MTSEQISEEASVKNVQQKKLSPKEVEKQEREKEKLKQQAEEDQKTYDALNFHDDQIGRAHV